MKATRALAVEAERHGAAVLTGQEVTGLAPDGGGVQVTTAERQWRADALVLAAGP